MPFLSFDTARRYSYDPAMTQRIYSLPVAAAISLVAVVVQAQPIESGWTPARTPWGDPDIQGVYTNKDENGTPFERPAEFAGIGLAEFTANEMAALREQRQALAQARAGQIGGTADEDTGAGPPHWYEHLDAMNSQPWLVVEPEDGKIPPLTQQGQRRQAAQRAAFAKREAPDTYTDMSLYDRCISRGLPGSMMPAIYGNAYDITQGPGYVAIRYEMIHEVRIISLDGRPRLPPGLTFYMGDARGHWEGDSLVVETTNFNPAAAYRNASGELKITERFTPTDADTLRWELRFDDPETWQAPWAFAMPLKRDSSSPVFEYACHEGNRGLENILRAARAAD
jgi:hypothetical protein